MFWEVLFDIFEFLIIHCHEQNKMNSLFLNKFHHDISYLMLVLNNIYAPNKVILTVIFKNQVFECFDR